MFDILASRAKVGESIANASLVANTNGTGVDLQQCIGDVLFLISCGLATAGTTPTMDFKVQDSADNTTFADVTGATFTQVTGAAGNGLQTKVIKKDKLKRYVRLVGTIGGTSSPAFPAAGLVLALQNY